MSLKGKSYKMGLQELKEMIRSEVASAIKSMDGEAPTQDSTVGDLEDVIAQALELVEEKRKSRKEAGEEVGELTGEEIMEAVGEILDAAKSSDDPEEGKACDDPEEGKEGEDPEEGKEGDDPEEQPKKKAAPSGKKAAPAKVPTQKKYSDIFLSRGEKVKQKKAIPPQVQLTRAIKCYDVFGRHDPDAAAFYASKKYDDNDMAREFKALAATNPAAGGYLIPEVYLDQIIEMLYAKTVIFELGAQKVPMPSGNLNIPKMTGGARATWGGEQRKIAKSQPSFGNIRLSSKRLEAIVPQTRELLISTSYSADQIFANDLTRRMELGIDFGGMFGKGGEFQPLGIFADKEIEHIDAKAIGNTDLADANGKITADFPVYIRSKVLAKNVDDQKLGWVFNSVLEGYLMNMKTTTGAYIYRDEMTAGKLLGFPYKVSNQIATTDDGLTELGFGNWSDMLVGEQMGLETYTTLDGSWVDEAGVQHNAFEENLAATRALMYVDIAARHKESFLHVKNIKAI